MSQRLPGAYAARRRTVAHPFRRATWPVAQSRPPDIPAPGLREAIGIWLLFAAVTLAILIVYATHPAHVFYHYSGRGLPGAAGRALVSINFPFGFVALALLGVAIARLDGFQRDVPLAMRRGAGLLAIIAVPLLLVAAWPGVVSQAKLDARPIHAVPALGVALALAVTLITWRATGAGDALPWHRADGVRVAAIFGMALLGLPWILAELGVWIANVPLLDRWFSPAGTAGGHRPIGVHLGDHHGLDGVLFATTALILSRGLAQIGVPWLRRALTAYLGLMLVYGLANALQDLWGE